MKNVLVINSSLNGENGNSTKLATHFADQLKKNKALNFIERDLSQMNLPHLGQDEMAAWMTPANERSAQQKLLAELSDELIAEVKASDTLVIGMPMYNFGIPSVFKAWIDRIARAGITFRYTENGPQGLLENKKVIVLAARGGIYAGTAKDTQTQYLKDFFAFIGITDVEFIYAEGLAMATKEKSWQQAQEKIIELIENIAA